MRYVGRLFRPPSEAHSYILQASIGCSHNLCTYCDMYRDKTFLVRKIDEVLEDIELASQRFGGNVRKVFVADGDALVLQTDYWLRILTALRTAFPALKQVSCYATAGNVLEKSAQELSELEAAGLNLLYIGPESGDAETLKRIVKGATFDDHVNAANMAHAAGMRISTIFLLGAGGEARSDPHAEASAALITAMDPEFLAALTLTVVPNTPLARMEQKGRFRLPTVEVLLGELRTMIDLARPTNALFRTNHASNYLPLAGRLPKDRDSMVAILDAALMGKIPLRPERSRGL